MLGDALKVTLPEGAAEDENERTFAVHELDVLIDATSRAVHVRVVKVGAALTVIDTEELVEGSLPPPPP